MCTIPISVILWSFFIGCDLQCVKFLFKMNYGKFQFFDFHFQLKLIIGFVTVIKEANWLTLEEDLESDDDVTDKTFDSVICCGNSFAHLPDFEGTVW